MVSGLERLADCGKDTRRRRTFPSLAFGSRSALRPERVRELALFNLAVDSELRSCDLVKLRVRDVTRGDRVATRAIVMQQKTGRPVQFEITEQTREAIAAWASRQPCIHCSNRHGMLAIGADTREQHTCDLASVLEEAL